MSRSVDVHLGTRCWLVGLVFLSSCTDDSPADIIGTTTGDAVEATSDAPDGTTGRIGPATLGATASPADTTDGSTSSPGATETTDPGDGSPGSSGTSTDFDSSTGPLTAAETGGTAGSSDCPHAGDVRYSFNGVEDWPEDVEERLTAAMDEAVYYYNCYSDLSHDLTVNYNPGVPTAEANVDGWISFGTDRNYMVVATAMHEIGHTMGVGYYPWTELLQDGRWVGDAVDALMASIPADERDPDYGQRDYITADGLHFWPYGLNYASEHLSEWSLINHVRVVAAMRADKDEYLAAGG